MPKAKMYSLFAKPKGNEADKWMRVTQLALPRKEAFNLWYNTIENSKLPEHQLELDVRALK